MEHRVVVSLNRSRNAEKLSVTLMGGLMFALALCSCGGNSGASCITYQSAAITIAIVPQSGTWLALDDTDLAALLVAIKSALGPSASQAGVGVVLRQKQGTEALAELVQGAGEMVHFVNSGTLDAAQYTNDYEVLGFTEGTIAEITAESFSAVAPIASAGAEIAAVAAINEAELHSAFSFVNRGDYNMWTTVKDYSFLSDGSRYTPVIVIRPGEYLEVVVTGLDSSSIQGVDLSGLNAASIARGQMGGFNLPGPNGCSGLRYCVTKTSLSDAGICADLLPDVSNTASIDTIVMQGVASCGGLSVSLPPDCASTSSVPPNSSSSGTSSTSSSGLLTGTWASSPMTGITPTPPGDLAPEQAIKLAIVYVSPSGVIEGSLSLFANGLLAPTATGTLAGQLNGASVSLHSSGMRQNITFEGSVQIASAGISTMTGTVTVDGNSSPASFTQTSTSTN